MEMHDSACQFLYQNGDEFVLMDSKTFEEYSVSSKLIDPNLVKLMEAGTQVKLRLSEGRPIMVTGGQTLKCTVSEIQDSRESSDKKKYYRQNVIPLNLLKIDHVWLFCRAEHGFPARYRYHLATPSWSTSLTSPTTAEHNPNIIFSRKVSIS